MSRCDDVGRCDERPPSTAVQDSKHKDQSKGRQSNPGVMNQLTCATAGTRYTAHLVCQLLIRRLPFLYHAPLRRDRLSSPHHLPLHLLLLLLRLLHAHRPRLLLLLLWHRRPKLLLRLRQPHARLRRSC